MLCRKCLKNMASVRYSEVIDGQVREEQVCSDCLARIQAGGEDGFQLAESPDRVRSASPQEVVRETVVAQQTCPACGIQLGTILEKSRVGCNQCYDSFGGEVESLLEGLHRALQHKGKAAHIDDMRSRLRADIQTKRALLRSVLEAEDYEEAARLRDEIKSLESGLSLSEQGAD